MSNNPLLQFDVLPDFPAIKAEHIEPAVLSVLAQNKQVLAGLIADETVKQNPQWQTLMGPLDDMEDRLSKVWSTVSHLNSVNNTAQIREAYNKCQPLITAYYTELGQNRALFDCIEKLESLAETLNLSSAKRKVLKDYLLEFRLAGVDLEDDKKKKFATLEAQLSDLTTKFSNNVLDSTMAWSKHVEDVETLAGLPEATLNTAAELAQSKDSQVIG